MHTRIIIAAAAASMALALPLAVFAAGSASIQGPTPGATIAVGTQVTFNVSVSGFSGPAFALSDSFVGSSVGPANIDGSGNFSWTPTTADLGNHNITVRVADAAGDATQVEQSIFVTMPPSAAIEGLLPGPTVGPGQNVTFRVVASNFAGPVYTLSDSFASSSLTSKNITNSGYATWTPGFGDAGVHIITATVNDAQGNSATASTSVTVVGGTTVSTTAASQATAFVGIPFTFGLSSQGMTNPVYSVRDSFMGSSLNATTSINGSGQFSWVPTQSDIGGHTLTITASDANAHVSNVTLEVEVVAATSTASNSSQTIGVPLGPTTPAGSAGSAASGLSAVQVQAILALLQSFGADAATVDHVSAALGATPASSLAGSGSGATRYTFVSPLTLGDSGTEVTALQQKLLQLGFFTGEATGYYGSLTFAAVKAFQQAHGLEVVGSIGPLTRAALNQ